MKKNIVIVDDSDLCRLLAKKLIEAELKSLVKINDYKSVELMLEKWLPKLKSIDLLLIDYLMPGMNGDELVRYLRDNNIDIPVIFITASRDEVSISNLNKLENSPCSLIIKPYLKGELIDSIKNIII